MKEVGTAEPWTAMEQTTLAKMELDLSSYAEKMQQATQKDYAYREGSPSFTKEQEARLRTYLIILSWHMRRSVLSSWI
jgi:hypothetical protein